MLQLRSSYYPYHVVYIIHTQWYYMFSVDLLIKSTHLGTVQMDIY